MEFNLEQTRKGLRITGSDAEEIANKFIETACKENYLSIIISNKKSTYFKIEKEYSGLEDLKGGSTILLPFNSDEEKNTTNIFLKAILNEFKLQGIEDNLFIFIDDFNSINEIVDVLNDFKSTGKVSFVSTFIKINKELTFSEKLFLNSFKLRIIANDSKIEFIDFSEKHFENLIKSINVFIRKKEIED